MKVFLASSQITSDDSTQLYQDLVNYIKHTYASFHYERDLSRADENLSFDKLVEEIAAADVFIAEMSYASQTLGFQLAHALRIGKPCLYLYDPSFKGRPSGLIGDIPSRNLKIKEYGTHNYEYVIDSFMKFAEKQQHTYRTSFMSTQEIDDYLSSHSRQLAISKGEMIRELLHRSIHSDQ